MPQREVADFTTNDARPVICQRCRESFKSGTELYYMRDSKPDGPGKHVCAGCRQYYLRKTEQRTAGIVLSASHTPLCRELIHPGTARHSLSRQVTPGTQGPTMSDPAVNDIRKAVAAAQRQGQSILGKCIQRSDSRYIGNNHPLRIGPGVESIIHRGNDRGGLPWPRSSSTSKHAFASNVPAAQDMGQGIFRPLVLPKFVTNPKLPLKNGYQDAHKLYDEMRYFFAQKASSVHNNEVVVIKVTMMTLKPGNRNPMMVSVCPLNVVLTLGND
jgi:hypothetical protein